MNSSSDPRESFYFRIKLSYMGQKYCGWQKQPRERTIQGELEGALRSITKSERVSSIGSGRTDSGVHALGQIVKIDVPLNLPPLSLQKALNSNLPAEIRVLEVSPCDADFHPIFHAKSKHYHYYFSLPEENGPSVFQNGLVASAPWGCDLNRLKSVLPYFIGKKNFINFRCEGTETASTIREIYSLDLVELGQVPMQWNKTYALRFHGNGFLKQMVRLIVGSIWEYSKGKVSDEELQHSFQAFKSKKLGPVAPPDGLYLVEVIY